MTASTEGHDASEIALRARQLRALVSSLVGDPDRAADVEQEVWLSALQGPLDRIHSWRSWCRAAALNLVRGRRRRPADGAAIPLEDEVPSADRDPSETVEQLQAWRRLNDALARLKEPVRSAVVMRFLAEKEPREIARELGIPASTVRSRIARGLEQLRKDMDRGSPDVRRAWAVTLAGLFGISVPNPSTIGAGVPPRVALASRVTRLVFGGIVVKKVIAPVVVLGLVIAVLAGLEFGGGEARLEPRDEVATADRGELAARREKGTPLAANEDPIEPASAEGPAAPPPTRGWTLAGSVSTPEGTPISGARIILRPLVGPRGTIALEPDDEKTSDGTIARAFSSPDGTFELTSPEAGRFECFAHADGHRPRRELVTLRFEARSTAHLELILEPLRTRTCVVLDDEGVPLADAPVVVWLDARDDWEMAPLYVEYRARTDEAGTFEVARFPRSATRDGSPGGVVVRVEHPDFARLRFKRLDGLPRDAVGRTILQLERGRPARLEFRDRTTGEAVPGVAFRLVSVFGTWSAKGEANADGVAELTRIASSPIFELVLLSKDWTHDGARNELHSSRRIFRVMGGDRAEFAVDLRPALVATGRLVEATDGRPIAGVRVRAGLADRYDPDLARVLESSCTTDEDGEFVLEGLSTDLLEFSIDSRDRVLLGVVPYEGGEPRLELRLGPEGGRSLRLLATRATSIRGFVRDAEGRPLPGASVRLMPPVVEEEPGPPSAVATTTSDSEGHFVLDGLRTGKGFSLIAEHPAYAAVGRRVDLTTGDAPRREDFRLTAGASLEVRVVGADSVPLEDVRVEVASGLLSGDAASAGGATSIRSSLTSSDGSATFDRLSTGPTDVVLSDDGADGERFPMERRRLELLEGTQSVLIRLESRHFVRGIARRRDGRPIANARLVFGTSAEAASIDEILVMTDPAGNFAFEARKPASAVTGSSDGRTVERRLGEPAHEGDVGWSYVLLRAEVWELRQPSRLTDADTSPLRPVDLCRLHPRRDHWVVVFE